MISSFNVKKAGLESMSISRRPQQRLVDGTPADPPTRQALYLQVGVDGGDLGGAAGRHSGLDDLNGRV